MLENIKAVIFDVDGTLLDSMWIWTEVDDWFLEKYHLTKPEGFHEGMEGMSYSETAQYFLDLFPSLPHTREQLEAEWYEMAYELYSTKLTLKPGAYEFIKTMHEQGIKLGIATSNNRELAISALKHNRVFDCIDSIWTACEVNAGKPNPAVYLRVAEDLEVEPEHCLVFEDVPNGILAGKNAGMKVCAVEDAFSKPQETKKRALADYYIQDYNDIKDGSYEVLS
ncbi:MAG: HAD family phosphatase [Faecalimonas sp.]|nr:HAD family phosphatase [Faecalimonas sp.]